MSGADRGAAAGAPALKAGLFESCVETLRSWQPDRTDQERLRSHYLDHLAAHPDGWSRGCPGAHLTASSLICAPAAGAVLLTLHARIGRWLQTGGHIEETDLDLCAAALREATEESGLTALSIDPVPLLLSRHEVPCGVVRPTYHLDVQFLVLARQPDVPTTSSESLDLGWFRHHQLPETDASVRGLVAAAGHRLDW